MIQWLRFNTFTPKSTHSVPGRGNKSPQTSQCGQKKKDLIGTKSLCVIIPDVPHSVTSLSSQGWAQVALRLAVSSAASLSGALLTKARPCLRHAIVRMLSLH